MRREKSRWSEDDLVAFDQNNATPAASNERLSVNAPFPDGERKEDEDEKRDKSGKFGRLLASTRCIVGRE